MKRVLLSKAAGSLTFSLHLLPLALAKPAPASKASEQASQEGMWCSGAYLPPLAPAFSLRALSAAASSFCFCLNFRSSSSSSLPCFLGACSPGSPVAPRGVVRRNPAGNRQACARRVLPSEAWPYLQKSGTIPQPLLGNKSMQLVNISHLPPSLPTMPPNLCKTKL